MRKSGVYAIVNMINQKQYIGSSVNIRNRWKQHRIELRGGKHHSNKLQRAWNKYSKDAFRFVILEEVEPDFQRLAAREQYYLDAYKPEYNIFLIAYSASGAVCAEETKAKIGAKNRGHQVSEEQREMLRQANLGKKLTPEQREKHKAAMNRPEVKAKMSKPRSKPISPEGRENIRRAQLITQNRPEVKERQRQVQTGKKMPREAVERASKARTGQKRTLEQRERISQGHLHYTPEQRERMRQSRLRYLAEQRRLENDNPS